MAKCNLETRTTRRVLVIAAHPDDEVLGCGGTIAKLSAEGADVHIAFLADGVGSRKGNRRRPAAGALKQRRKAAQAACRILGAKSVVFGDLPDNRMDTVALLDVVKQVETLIARHRPSLLLTHHCGDLNIDHQRVHAAVVTACRPQPSHGVRTLLFFEVPSSTEWQVPAAGQPFEPNWFVDVSATLAAKIAALHAYDIEMRPWPHPRSAQALEHLARWRGATVGAEAAEAFVLGRNMA